MQQSPVVQKFIRIYQNSETVRTVSKKSFSNDDRLYTLAWLKK